MSPIAKTNGFTYIGSQTFENEEEEERKNERKKNVIIIDEQYPVSISSFQIFQFAIQHGKANRKRRQRYFDAEYITEWIRKCVWFLKFRMNNDEIAVYVVCC